jgi:hypothetical protein
MSMYMPFRSTIFILVWGVQGSTFVYNTGRSWESTRKVMEDLKHVPMLTPRAVIASVGTEVRPCVCACVCGGAEQVCLGD